MYQTDERGNFVRDDRGQMVKRGNGKDTFVPAAASGRGNAEIARQMAGELLQPGYTLPDTGAVWSSVETVQERTSAQDRARGYGLRLGIVTVGVGVLAIVGGILTWAMVGGLAGLLAFLALFGGGYYVTALLMNKQDYRHSATGVEHRRIEEAGRTMRHAISEQELTRREALRMYGKLLKGD